VKKYLGFTKIKDPNKNIETTNNKKVFPLANNFVKLILEYCKPKIVEKIMENDKNKYK
jgi:hypothetical protein